MSWAQSPALPAAGTRIVDYITALEAEGFSVIYSTDVLSDDLLVESTPTISDPIERLRAVLAPYHLALQAGPRRSWLVVPIRDADRLAGTAPETPRLRPEVGPPPLENVIVSASRYSFVRSVGPSTAQLDRTQLENSPTLGDDAIRATQSLPGVTSSGLTARSNVRGGESNEALLYLDGVRLYNPFHLKDFQSLFSTIDPRLMESISVFTGAYPVEYGDRMSAVIDMRTETPAQRRFYEVGFSTLTSRVLSSGQFADGRGTWLTSARRGNLDLLIDATNSEVGSPQYADLYSKLSYDINASLSVTSSILLLDDEIVLRDGDIGFASAKYRDRYLSTRFDYSAEKLQAELLVAGTTLATNRNGNVDDPNGSFGQLDDIRNFSSTQLRAQWTYDFNDANRLRWGVELDESDARYDYTGQRMERVPIITPGLEHPPEAIDEKLSLSSRQHAMFLSYRARPFQAVTAEIGLRVDRQELPADRQFSPRFNVLFDLTSRVSLRASWGQFFQAQELNELQISDGITQLFTAQQAEHGVIGFEYLIGETTSLRIEVYRKEFEKLRPRFENLFSRVTLLPELQSDRVLISPLSGEASGLEISASGQKRGWSWWLNLTRSTSTDVFVDGEADRSWEEPWSLKGGATRSAGKWTLSVAGTWHTGWPVTDLQLVGNQLVAGQFNAKRFETFRTIDLRASRRTSLARGETEWYFELNNLFNRENQCCLEYALELDDASNPVGLSKTLEEWYGIVPTIGFIWRHTPRNP